ncbi:MAG: PepSY domain-containing protein [Candidatus Thorarchaeota archaeon]|nr:PepSY domain-containing protein [Candidatus Thorarchaeota archaeon]
MAVSSKTIVAMMSLALVLALFVTSLSVGLPVVRESPGISVAESPYSDFIGYDARIQNMTSYVISVHPLIVNYSNLQPLISEDDAVASALSFVKFNYPWVGDINNVTHLGLLDRAFAWRMFLFYSSLEFEVWVSASSGAVIHLSVLSTPIHNPDYNGTHQYIDPSVAITTINSFLKVNNIRIPEDARYLGFLNTSPSPPSQFFTGPYVLAFLHTIGGVPFVSKIPFNAYSLEGIFIEVDPYSAVVCAFHYLWRDIGDMSFSRIITSQRALEIARSFLNSSSDYPVILANLTVSDVGMSSVSKNDDAIRLVWRIVVNKDLGRKDILIDAFTGEVLETQLFREQINLPPLRSEDPITVLWIVSVAAASASIIFVLMKKVIGYRCII